jgi:hypothetical protein
MDQDVVPVPQWHHVVVVERAVLRRGLVARQEKEPSLAPVFESWKKDDFLTTSSVASHSAWTPPPGSWPKMSVSPSQLKPAECPIVTPGSAAE